MLGIGLALLAAISWGVSNTVVRPAFQHMNATTGTLVSLVAGSVVIWTLTFAFNLSDLRDITLTTVLWFAAVGLLNFAMGRAFSYRSISRLGVARTTPVLATAPLFATAFAILFVGERLNAFIIVGMALVLAGLYVTIREGLRS